MSKTRSVFTGRNIGSSLQDRRISKVKSYLGIFSSDATGIEELFSGATVILCSRRENVRSSRRDGNPSFLFNSEFQPWRRSFLSIELLVCRSDAFTTCFGALFLSEQRACVHDIHFEFTVSRGTRCCIDSPANVSLSYLPRDRRDRVAEFLVTIRVDCG